MHKTIIAVKRVAVSPDISVANKPTGTVTLRGRGRSGKAAKERWLDIRNAFLKRSVADQIQVIRDGMRAKNLVMLAEAVQVPQEMVFRVVGIPLTTAKRKLSKDENLDSATTERLIRIYRIEKLAEDVFGNGDDAREWLRTENLGLGSAPLSMLDTDLGAQEVSRILHAIAYGGAA